MFKKVKKNKLFNKNQSVNIKERLNKLFNKNNNKLLVKNNKFKNYYKIINKIRLKKKLKLKKKNILKKKILKILI